MKTILYLQSSLAASNNSDLDGVYRYAKSANWKIRVAPYSDAAYIRGDRANGRDIQDLGGRKELRLRFGQCAAQGVCRRNGKESARLAQAGGVNVW